MKKALILLSFALFFHVGFIKGMEQPFYLKPASRPRRTRRSLTALERLKQITRKVKTETNAQALSGPRRARTPLRTVECLNQRMRMVKTDLRTKSKAKSLSEQKRLKTSKGIVDWKINKKGPVIK